MVEYTALIVAAVGLMFYLLYFANQLRGSQADTIGLMEGAKIFYIGLSLSVGLLVLGASIYIADVNGAPQGLKNAFSMTFRLWGWIVIATILFLVLYVTTLVPYMTRQALKGRDK